MADNLTLDDMLAHIFPKHKERLDAAALLKRVKDLESLLNMKDIEIGLLRRDVARLRATMKKRAFYCLN